MGFEIAFAVAIFPYKNNLLKAKINFKPVFSKYIGLGHK
jgi:hypothetical protein